MNDWEGTRGSPKFASRYYQNDFRSKAGTVVLTGENKRIEITRETGRV